MTDEYKEATDAAMNYGDGFLLAKRLAISTVDRVIFDLPIGNDVTYSRGYSAGVAAARESLREALKTIAPDDNP